MKKKNVVILGSTGSIGENAVKIAKHLPNELSVYGLVAKNNIAKLAEQAISLNCKNVITSAPEKYNELKKKLPTNTNVATGEEAIIELVTDPNVDIILCAIVGTGGLLPVLEAVKAGKDIALASKEVLVMAGELVMNEVKKQNIQLLPVDSEHNAIFQCIEGKKYSDVEKLILTASGGPFRNASLTEIQNANYAAALKHPTWAMGPKITIDSASLMNKALEIVEARWLFDIEGSKIDVIVHPQSIIHSMVEFIDGTVLAQMSSPDMKFPIQYALTYPHKHIGTLPSLDFAKLANLTFEAPRKDIFPALDFAYYALEKSGTMPVVMNAANEVAVQLFSQDKIKFTEIWSIIEKTMDKHKLIENPTLDDILNADEWARTVSSNQ